jgi:prepilin-type N-terminal cleavage/methylation domain-containing protein
MIARTSKSGRPGVTLIEVLVAIFVAAVGTLSLLVLFPLAALNMRQALVDDRCAQAGINAAAFIDSLGYRTDGITSTGTITSPSIAAQLVTSGNPVYVDAIGAQVICGGGALTSPNLYVGGLGATSSGYAPPAAAGINRLQPSFITSSLMAYKFFRLQDDLNYSPVGVADTTGGFINRVGRYTWAYMVRPPASIYCPGIADMSVVVYNGRNTSTPGGETCYLPATNPAGGTTYPVGSTSIVLQYGGTPLPIATSLYYSTNPPQLRRGNWILDASKFDSANDPAAIGNIHSFFYRIVDVTDVSSGGLSLVQLDLETPLVAAIDCNGATTPGIIVVLDNVANVYERLTGRLP